MFALQTATRAPGKHAGIFCCLMKCNLQFHSASTNHQIRMCLTRANSLAGILFALRHQLHNSGQRKMWVQVAQAADQKQLSVEMMLAEAQKAAEGSPASAHKAYPLSQTKPPSLAMASKLLGCWLLFVTCRQVVVGESESAEPCASGVHKGWSSGGSVYI